MTFERFARAGMACVVGLTAVASVRADVAPTRLPTQASGVTSRVPGFEDTQAWFRQVRHHQVWQSDAALAAVAKLPPPVLQRVAVDLRHIHMLIDKLAFKKADFVDVGNRRLAIQHLAPLLGLTVDELDLPLDLTQLSKPDNHARVTISRLMMRAAILHTAIAASPEEETAAPRPAPVAGNRPAPGRVVARPPIRIQDGRQIGLANLSVHWVIARAALDLVGPPPSGSSAVRLWYHATSALMQGRRDYAALEAHLVDARGVLPSDARTFLMSGAMCENMAAPPIQSVIEESGLVDVAIEPVGQLRSLAERYLRRALELDATSALARLRLGRVLQLTVRHDEAADLFRAAETGLSNPRGQYMAALFLGRTEEARNRDEQARAAYERAVALFPNAQSPRLALVAMAARTGDPAAAVPGLRALFRAAEGAGRETDPWWTYDTLHVEDLADLWDQMRQATAEAVR